MQEEIFKTIEKLKKEFNHTWILQSEFIDELKKDVNSPNISSISKAFSSIRKFHELKFIIVASNDVLLSKAKLIDKNYSDAGLFKLIIPKIERSDLIDENKKHCTSHFCKYTFFYKIK